MTIGFMYESLLWLEKSILDLELELISYLISMDKNTESLADIQDTSMPTLKLSDGDSNNWRSKKSLKKIRKEINSRLTLE